MAAGAPPCGSSHPDFFARHRGREAAGLFESSLLAFGAAVTASGFHDGLNLISLGPDVGTRPVSLHNSRRDFVSNSALRG